MKKSFVIVALILGMILGACGVQHAVAQQDNPMKIWPENKNGAYETLKVIDDDTGVNYLVVSAHYSDNGGYAVAIVPRLNADGTLYVSGK